MKICVIGAGHMGAWLVEEFCLDHDVAVYDVDPRKMKYFYKVHRFKELVEIKDFAPDMAINAVSLHKTREVFDEILSLIPKTCLLADITSVKNGLYNYYQSLGQRFVSVHPMFGPTFSNIRDLRNENAIIIEESDEQGKEFFRSFFQSLKLRIHEFSFEEHDRTIAYSLSVPFASSMVFAACMKQQDAPGTTFKRHETIAKGLLSEDDYLLSEIMFNAHTLKQIESINAQLSYLTHIIKGRDTEEMQKFLTRLRRNMGMNIDEDS
jgi:prephenate dehydrogenase